MNYSLSLTLVISICVLITGGIAFADEIKSIKPFWKLVVFVAVSGIAIWLTIKKEQLGEKEKADDKEAFRVERQRTDSANDARLRAFERSVIGQLQNLNVKVTNIAPITSISFKKSSEGLIVSYHLTKSVEKLSLLRIHRTFDDTFGPSFGDNIEMALPTRHGDHSIIVDLDKFPIDQVLKVQIKGEGPYISSPIVELDHSSEATVDSSTITTDNVTITVDKN